MYWNLVDNITKISSVLLHALEVKINFNNPIKSTDEVIILLLG